MKRLANRGYTIIEVMMFLLVSSAIMASTIGLVTGRQERTRFTQSVGSLEQNLKDLMNDIAVGYYPSAGDFSCTSASGVITLTTGGSTPEQGSNPGCIFLGKAIEFTPNSTAYSAFTMIGARPVNSGLKDPLNLTEAGTELLGGAKRKAPNVGSTNTGIVDRRFMQSDLVPTRIVSLADAGHDVRGIAIVSDFSQVNATTRTVTGNATRGTMYEVLNPFQSTAGTAGMPVATDGVALCLQQGGVNGRRAIMTIGASGQLSIETRIVDEGGPWPAPCN